MNRPASSSHLIHILAVYILAHVGLLFTSGVFLDTWTIVHGDARLNIEYLTQTGRPIMGYFLNFILGLGGTFAGRVWIFLMYLLSGLFLYQVLRREKNISPVDRFFLVALFLTFPVDIGRVSVIRSYSITCYAFFFLGFYLVSLYLATRKPYYRIGAYLAFLFSFWINSFLVFYVIVLLYVGYKELEGRVSFQKVWALVPRYADLILLPGLFWVFQKLFFAPSGNYQHYNKVQLVVDNYFSKIIKFFTYGLNNINGAFFDVFDESVKSMTPSEILIMAVLAILLYRWFRRGASELRFDKTDVWLFVLGVGAFLVAIFPYTLVGKIADQTDWNSRHSQLVPLGAAFFLYYGLKGLWGRLRLKNQAFYAILIALLAFFITANFKNYLEYWQDWYKYRSFVQQARHNETIRSHTTFGVVDQGCGQGDNLNAQGRFLRFYEYSGLLELAFGDTRRMAGIMCRLPFDRYSDRPLTWDDLKRFRLLIDGVRNQGPQIKHYRKIYNLAGWELDLPTHVIHIEAGEAIGSLNLLVMKFQEIFNGSRLEENLNEITSIRVEEYKRGK